MAGSKIEIQHAEMATSNKLCGTCNGILETIREVDWHTNLVHHRSLATLSDSAQAACGICAVLLGHLQSNTFENVPDLWDEVFPIKCESDTSSAGWQDSFELILTSDSVESLNLKFALDAIETPPGW